jgi:cellulose synthase (UDP-forming)
VSSEGNVLRVHFEGLSIAEEEVLTMVLYSRADSWLGWGESRESDNVLNSLGRIFRISMHGLAQTFRALFTDKNKGDRPSNSLSIARTGVILLIAALVLGGAVRMFGQAPAGAAAQKAAIGAQTATATAQNAAVTPGHYQDTFSLNDAGSPQIEMHGIDSMHSIYFTLPETHVVRTAKIHVYYAFSPSLLPQLSHIKLILNGTLFATIQPTPGQVGGSDSRDAETEFDIPTDLLVHNNTLTLEFIGHYTMVCEDPANTTLWARVHRNTFVDVRGDLLPLADDLKQLPQPFLDPAVIQPPSVPIVFAAQPSYKAIQAAGIITSYFGMISENRAVRFPVHIGSIPTGNAIIIADNAASLPASLGLPTVNGPTVAMRTNPSDPYSKLLIVAGGNPDQLVIAAQAVALHSDMLAGAQTGIDTFKLPERQPADGAPRWARTDQTIALWDYAASDQLQGDGTAPLNVYFRIPPDIFYADRPNAILKLVYRYNSIPIGPISSMQVRVNDAFLGSLPLVPGQEASRKMETEVSVPVVNLRPFSNSLSFDFTFQLLKKGGCQDTTPINMQGSILRDSYLDLRGYPHYAPLPNLELFSNAGFPFTRFADLGQTTVVLPHQPLAQEIETFVTLMGHFGRQTGFPALRVIVDGPDALLAGSSQDFLIIGAGNDQPAFEKLGGDLPVSLGSGQIQVHDTQGFFVKLFHNSWWKLKTGEHAESGDLTLSGVPDAVIEGIKSPYDPGGSRSIVAIHLRDADVFESFMDTFMKVQQSSDVSGSVAVLHGTQFESFRIGSDVYDVGTVPWWVRLQMWLRKVPWIVAVIVLILAFLVAVWTRQALRGRARARLRMIED